MRMSVITTSHLVLLLSNKKLQKMLLRDFQFKEIETLEIHVNTFKTLVTRITEYPDLITLFYNGSKDSIYFPLLYKAVSLPVKGSPMARTTVQQFVLQFIDLSTSYPPLSRYLGYFPFANYYILYTLSLGRMFEELYARIREQKNPPPVLTELSMRINSLEDQYSYLNDLFHHRSIPVGIVIPPSSSRYARIAL